MYHKQWSDDLKCFIKDNFTYTDDGELIDLDRKKHRLQPIDHGGYKTIKIKGKYMKVHHILYFLYHGKQAEMCIDHIDGNRINNRIENLRDVPIHINNLNKHNKNPITGYVGVYYDVSTNGLLAKYTKQVNGKTYRFRKLEDCLNLRMENGLNI